MNSRMRFAQRLGMLVAVVVGTVALAVPAAAETDRPESCRMLRAAEITQALEQPTAGAAPNPLPSVCGWSLAATANRPAGAVFVYLRRGGGATHDYDLARDFSRDSRIKLRGLGRRAFYAPALETVYVLQDSDTVFFVKGAYPTGAPTDPTGLQTALVALAGKVARRA